MIIVPPSIKDVKNGSKLGRFIIVNDCLRVQPK